MIIWVKWRIKIIGFIYRNWETIKKLFHDKKNEGVFEQIKQIIPSSETQSNHYSQRQYFKLQKS